MAILFVCISVKVSKGLNSTGCPQTAFTASIVNGKETEVNLLCQLQSMEFQTHLEVLTENPFKAYYQVFAKEFMKTETVLQQKGTRPPRKILI